MNASFAIYMLGYLVVIAGVAYGMHAAGLDRQWILAAVLILAGIGIIGSLSRSRRDDTPD